MRAPGRAGARSAVTSHVGRSGAERLDPVVQPRNLPARGVLVQDALVGTAHDLRLRGLEGGGRLCTVAAGDRFLDLADEGPHARLARLVDCGAPRDLAH